jgi:electron transfer flavoprotein beta subunit
MKIVVCLKQVPDTNEVKIDPVKETLIEKEFHQSSTRR